MAIVSSDFLAGVLTNFRALFEDSFNGALAVQGWTDLAIELTHNGETLTFEWFGTVPVMQDVTHDTVELRGLTPYNFSLAMSDYQSAIEVDRKSLERDQLNLIGPRIQQMAGEAARHPGFLLYDLVRANGNAYDASAFFADTRVIGESANIDNSIAGTGTTVAQFQADLASGRSAMRKFQDDRGRAINQPPNVIMVPPEMEQVAWQSLNVNQAGQQDRAVPSADTGTFRAGGYLVVVNAELTDVNNWYLFRVGGPAIRPFVYGIEKRPVLESDTNPTSRENIIKRKFIYSVYGRYAVGMTDPRLGVLITNT